MTGRTLVRLRRGVLVFLATLVVATGCGGSGSTPSALSSPTGETPPDLAKFLQLPVATPSACPSNVSGSTVGRASPWVGHVDLSVFISTSATKPASSMACTRASTRRRCSSFGSSITNVSV